MNCFGRTDDSALKRMADLDEICKTSRSTSSD
jgi:hypothetical protein